MVDVEGDDKDDVLSSLAETAVVENEDLDLSGIVNGEDNNGGLVVGESVENNENGKDEQVEEGRVEEGKDKEVAEEEERVEQVDKEEKKSEENGVVAMEKNGGLETEADKVGVEMVETNVEGAKKEAADGGKTTENSQKKVDENSTQKGRKPKKRIRKKKVVQGVSKVASKDEDKPESSVQKKVLDTVVSKNEDKPESSKKKRNSKKVESMGMIFMCTSKTKRDCYRYKLLGLPAGKKELVEKIYKGMRLFLFDLDLRLLYGIYKAAAPGGTNIEPKAFKSAFPSQVRFTVLEDCLPLAEEKFKEAIKENYYSRNKFDCQLNAEQVKKLCKLFVSVSKGSAALQKISKSLVVGHEGLKQQDREEKKRGQVGRASEGVKQTRDEKRGRKRRDRDEGSSRKQRDWDEERGRKRRGRREERKSPPRREQRHHEPVIHANEISYSQVAPPNEVSYSQVAPLHGAYQLPAPVYTYERTMEMNPYRREPVLEHRGIQVVGPEPRHHDETKNIDAYISYREREAPSFRRPIYSSPLEREYYTPAPPTYLPAHIESERHTTSRVRDYHQPRTLTSEYLPSRREIEYVPSRREVEYRITGSTQPTEYHSTRALPVEYHASRSLLAEYRAAGLGLPTEDLPPTGVSSGYHRAGPPTEYRTSGGGLHDYRSLQPRYR